MSQTKKIIIERIFPYHVLTDTDSTCLLFLIICNVKNSIPDKQFREVIFEVIVANKIYDRFNTSRTYWENLMRENRNCKKCLGYLEIERIDNPCEIVVAVNPKEYYEHFEDFRCNKQHKGIKKGSPGINFENFTKRIVSVNEI